MSYREEVKKKVEVICNSLSDGLDRENIKAWEEEEVTRLFFAKLGLMLIDTEVEIFNHLNKGDDAAFGLSKAAEMLQQIMELPELLKEESKNDEKS